MIDEDRLPPLFANMVNGMPWREPCTECHGEDMVVVMDIKNPFLICTRCNPHADINGDGLIGVCAACGDLWPLFPLTGRDRTRNTCEGCHYTLCEDCHYFHAVKCSHCRAALCIDRTTFDHPAGDDNDGETRYLCEPCLDKRGRCPDSPTLYVGNDGSQQT